MTPEIYNALKTRLLTLTGSDNKPLFKTVMLFNDQIQHLVKDDNDNYPINFPACFIQFTNIQVTNLLNKATVQQVNFDTTLHIARRVLANEDVEILNDKLKVYQLMQRTEFTSSEPECSRFTRISEQPNYDNNLLMVYEQTYHATYKDFSAVPTPNTGDVTTLVVNQSISNTIS